MPSPSPSPSLDLTRPPAADLSRAELLHQRAELLPKLYRQDSSMRRALAGFGVTVLESVLLAPAGDGIATGGPGGIVCAVIFLLLAAAALLLVVRVVRAGHVAITVYQAWIVAAYDRPGPPVPDAPAEELTVLDAGNERVLAAVADRDRDRARFAVTAIGVMVRAGWVGLALGLSALLVGGGIYSLLVGTPAAGGTPVSAAMTALGTPLLVSALVTGAGVAHRSYFFTRLRVRIGRLAKHRRAELRAQAAATTVEPTAR